MLGQHLKRDFVLNSTCVQCSYRSFFLCVSGLYVLSSDAPFTVRFCLCFQAVPAQPREQLLELAPPKAAAEIFLVAPLRPPAAHGAADVSLRAQLPCSLRCPRNSEQGLAKPGLQPCRMIWKDRGIFLVLRDRVQE